ncbi:MAG: hypothetical protein Kow0049_09950 [Stanieria sp.]
MSTLLSSPVKNPTEPSVATVDTERLTKCYQADQQVKYLHLQAEIEVLLQELQTIKEQKLVK